MLHVPPETTSTLFDEMKTFLVSDVVGSTAATLVEEAFAMFPHAEVRLERKAKGRTPVAKCNNFG
jgi:hypothetical protein